MNPSKLIRELLSIPEDLDPRDRFIARVVQGRSFADVGGLWGTVNEKVSTAHRSGAASLAMIDLVHRDDELWRAFAARCRLLQVPEVTCISADVQALAGTAGGMYDVVHCSGVLYHVPDPLRLLCALRSIAREHVVLSSVVSPTEIQNRFGRLEIPDACVLLVPALKDKERQIVSTYWQQFVGTDAVGLTLAIGGWAMDDYTPWWWLPTVEGLRALCTAAGFRFVEGAYMWNNNAYVQLLAVG